MKVFGRKLSTGEVILGAGVIGFLLYEGGKLGISAVNAKYLNYNIKDFQIDTTGGTISIEIVNPTPSQYTLQSLNLDISDNDTRIATATYMGQLVIAPKGTTVLQLNLTLDPAGLLDQVFTTGMQLLKSDSTDAQNITAKGSAQVDTIMLPVNMKLGVLPAQQNVF